MFVYINLTLPEKALAVFTSLSYRIFLCYRYGERSLALNRIKEYINNTLKLQHLKHQRVIWTKSDHNMEKFHITF